MGCAGYEGQERAQDNIHSLRTCHWRLTKFIILKYFQILFYGEVIKYIKHNFLYLLLLFQINFDIYKKQFNTLNIKISKLLVPKTRV